MSILDMIFPRTCPMCQDVLPYGEMRICDSCRESLPYITGPKCMKCGKEVASEEIEYCYDCHKDKHIYTSGRGVFSYSDELRGSIHRFKYKNKKEYTDFYCDAMAEALKETFAIWDIDGLVPIPLHKKKLQERGYNQATLLAKGLGERLGLPVQENYLERVIHTKPQKELDDRERKKNVENAFKIGQNVVKWKKIVLVDDIYTTGSTIDACANVLYLDGAENIHYVSLSIGTGF